MRIKRLGPGQYAILSNRKGTVGKRAMREIAEAEVLAKYGLVEAAKIFGLKIVGAGPAKIDPAESRAQLEQLMANATRPFKLPGIYGNVAKEEDVRIEAIRKTLIDSGVLLPNPRRKR